jgi:hypothetical protein
MAADECRVRAINSALAILLLVAACGGTAPSQSPEARTITGTFLLSNGELPDDRDAGGCSGTGGYADIKVGTGVVVRDAEGTIVGTAALAIDPNGPAPFASGNYQCGYAFTVAGLPDSAFYQVEVASRGALTYSLADLEAKAWRVSLDLGE